VIHAATTKHSPSSVAATIKRITAPAHRRAEAVVDAVDPFGSIASYGRYLTKLHAFYAALEPPLFDRLDMLVPDARRRRKLAWIEDDLRALAIDPPREVAVSVPRIVRDADAIGVAYVLEGKTLGSRFLLEEAKRRLALDGRGVRFFTGYGAETGAMWKAYRAELDEFARRYGQRRAIVNGALAAFASFTSWIAQAPA